MMFLETMQPTSVALSRKGRSHSSYRSKSTGLPEGCLSKAIVEAGHIFRTGGTILALRLVKSEDLNCFVLIVGSRAGSLDLRSAEEASVSAEPANLEARGRETLSPAVVPAGIGLLP